MNERTADWNGQPVTPVRLYRLINRCPEYWKVLFSVFYQLHQTDDDGDENLIPQWPGLFHFVRMEECRVRLDSTSDDYFAAYGYGYGVVWCSVV